MHIHLNGQTGGKVLILIRLMSSYDIMFSAQNIPDCTAPPSVISDYSNLGNGDSALEVRNTFSFIIFYSTDKIGCGIKGDITIYKNYDKNIL